MGVVIRQSLKGTFVNYIGVVLGIFVSFYCQTKWLSPEVIGLQKVLYEAAYLLSSLALLGSGSGGMRFFPFFKDEKTGNHGFFYYYLLFPLIGLPLMALIYLLFQQPIQGYFGDKSPLFNDFYYYVLPLMVMLAFWVWWENYANIHMRIAIPKAVREIGMRVFMGVIYFCYYLGYIDTRGLIISFIVAYGLCMVITGIYTWHIGCTTMKHDWNFVTPDLRQKVVRYSGFLMLSVVSGNIMAQLDLWMLTGVKGLYTAGIYTIVVYMAEVVNMPSRNITPISSPLAAEAMKEGDMDKTKTLFCRVSLHQMLASSFMLLMVWVNLDAIYAIIPSGELYEAGRWAVLFLGIGRIINGTINFGNILLSFSKYYYWTLIFTILLTFLTIGTNLYFIPLYGLTGAAIATLIAVSLSNLFLQILVSSKLKCHPFSWAHLRVVLVIAVLYGLNWLIPSLPHITESWVMAMADISLRSILLLVAAIVLIYKLNVSDQINGILKKYIKPLN